MVFTNLKRNVHLNRPSTTGLAAKIDEERTPIQILEDIVPVPLKTYPTRNRVK